MIMPMRKATILCLATERQEAVNALRDLGVLHVLHRESRAAGSKSEETSARREGILKALDILRGFSPESGAFEDRGRLPQDDRTAPDDVETVAARVRELQGSLKSLREEEERLKSEREAQLPLGNFNPRQVEELEESGVQISLFRIPAKADFPADEGVVLLGRGQDGQQYGVAFNRQPEVEGVILLPLPKRSLAELDSLLLENRERQGAVTEELQALAVHMAAMETQAGELEEKFNFQRVGESMALHGEIADLEGFCPEKKVPLLQKAARRNGWAIWLRDPDPDEEVPVALDLPRWLRPIATLFKGLGILPGYREADVSAVFLLFFSLFFAMLIGDAGYGLLMLGTVLFVRKLKPGAPAQPFWLFGIFAVATIIWGALSGSYFAIEGDLLPRFMRGIPWLQVDDNLMWLCFLIGGIHLSIAHIWNALVYFPSRKALAEIGWIGVVWLMFAVAANLVVGQEIPMFVFWGGGIGTLLIVLFMTDPRDLKDEWINHPMLVLNLVSCLVDVISYIRLFAVGMASAEIALNFNRMALDLPLPPWIKLLGVVLILVLGHGLNIMLGALSILVHAVRLNTLEFSNHKGLSWSGQPYTPFRGKDVPIKAQET